MCGDGDDVAKARELFDMLDEDRSGEVDRNEMMHALQHEVLREALQHRAQVVADLELRPALADGQDPGADRGL